MSYNKKHLERLAKNSLPNSLDKEWKDIEIGETEINISGKVCKVKIFRTSEGYVSITPIDEGIFEKGGWLCEGTCTEGYNDDVIISKFIHNDND